MIRPHEGHALSSLCISALALLSCASEHPPPQDPADQPRLPPMYSTSIALLADSADDLHLEGDQRSRIEAIGRKLDTENAPLQTELDDLERGTSSQPARAARRARGGGRRGGMGGHGGMGGAGPTSTTPASGAGTPPTQTSASSSRTSGSAAAEKRGRAENLRAQLADNETRALAEAVCVLDPAQRTQAHKLLEDGSFGFPDELDCVPDAEPGH